jgi:hypothetical protein
MNTLRVLLVSLIGASAMNSRACTQGSWHNKEARLLYEPLTLPEADPAVFGHERHELVVRVCVPAVGGHK